MRKLQAAAIATVVAAAAIFLGKLLAASRLQRSDAAELFSQIAPGLQRLQVDINTFLVRAKDGAVLVDTGVPENPYPESLVLAVKHALGSAQLRLVLLTHGHLDHAGSLSAVLDAWPNAQLAVHDSEHPWITEQVDHKEAGSQSNTWVHSHRWLYSKEAFRKATPERMLHLTGSEGDICELSSPAGAAIRWRPPEGLVRYVHLPGDSPVQVAYLHVPSRMLLAGDVFYHTTEQSEAPELSRLPRGLSWPNPDALQSIRHAASLDFDRAWPTHDAGQGVPKAAFAAWAAALEDDP